MNKNSKQTETEQYTLPSVSGSSIQIPKAKLKFIGLDNISIIGEKDIPLSELYELYFKLENYLKTRPETITNSDGMIVGLRNYRIRDNKSTNAQ